MSFPGNWWLLYASLAVCGVSFIGGTDTGGEENLSPHQFQSFLEEHFYLRRRCSGTSSNLGSRHHLNSEVGERLESTWCQGMRFPMPFLLSHSGLLLSILFACAVNFAVVWHFLTVLTTLNYLTTIVPCDPVGWLQPKETLSDSMIGLDRATLGRCLWWGPYILVNVYYL